MNALLGEMGGRPINLRGREYEWGMRAIGDNTGEVRQDEDRGRGRMSCSVVQQYGSGNLEPKQMIRRPRTLVCLPAILYYIPET